MSILSGRLLTFKAFFSKILKHIAGFVWSDKLLRHALAYRKDVDNTHKLLNTRQVVEQ